MKLQKVLFSIVLGSFLASLLALPFAIAQDAGPPAGYLDSCNGDPRLFEMFGPNCLNPVRWDLDGFLAIDTWVWFADADGTTDGGLVKGYTWNHFEGRYHYYVMIEPPYAGIDAAFRAIAAERIIGNG